METIKPKPSYVRALRRKHNLSVMQCAKALNKSPATIEAWESGRRTSPPRKEVVDKIRAYLQSGAIELDNNLLFGDLEFSVARRLLKKDLDALAQEHGYGSKAWQSFEMSRRTVPEPVLRRIEEQVRKKLKQLAVI